MKQIKDLLPHYQDDYALVKDWLLQGDNILILLPSLLEALAVKDAKQKHKLKLINEYANMIKCNNFLDSQREFDKKHLQTILDLSQN